MRRDKLTLEEVKIVAFREVSLQESVPQRSDFLGQSNLNVLTIEI